jgi:hypothetical protein
MRARSMSEPPGSRHVPLAVRVGAVVIGFGALWDLVEHTLVFRATSSTGFTAGEHGAHLLVLVGMVVVLAGVVADGRHSSRLSRTQGGPRDALR